MLSLIGSIQPDPFSPAHAPDHTVQSTTTKTQRQRKAPEPEPPVPEPTFPEELVDSEDEDTFQALGRMGDEAIARQAKAEEDAKSAKKRKRKEAKESAPDGEEEAQPDKKKKKKKTS